LRYLAPRFRLATYYYDYRIHDLIERYATSPDDFFFRNRGRAVLRGVELETQIDLPWRLSIEAAAQVARGRARDGNTFLDGITTETGSVQVRRAIGVRAFAQARLAHFADDDRPGPTERLVPGYTLVDVSGGATLGRHLELRALIRNALDQEYYASQDVRAVFAPGRAASLTAVVRF
jgi:outer membrane receptor protein involved in Fe transport